MVKKNNCRLCAGLGWGGSHLSYLGLNLCHTLHGCGVGMFSCVIEGLHPDSQVRPQPKNILRWAGVIKLFAGVNEWCVSLPCNEYPVPHPWSLPRTHKLWHSTQRSPWIGWASSENGGDLCILTIHKGILRKWVSFLSIRLSFGASHVCINVLWTIIFFESMENMQVLHCLCLRDEGDTGVQVCSCLCTYMGSQFCVTCHFTARHSHHLVEHNCGVWVAPTDGVSFFQAYKSMVHIRQNGVFTDEVDEVFFCCFCVVMYWVFECVLSKWVKIEGFDTWILNWTHQHIFYLTPLLQQNKFHITASKLQG